MKEKYLKLERGKWKYRRPVPDSLRTTFRKREFTKVLGEDTLDYIQAVQRCRAYNQIVERELALARAGTTSEVSEADLELARIEARRVAYEVERDDPEDGSWLTVDHLVEKGREAYIKEGLSKGRRKEDLMREVYEGSKSEELIANALPASERALLEELTGGTSAANYTLPECLPIADKWAKVKDPKSRHTAVDQFVEAVGDKAIRDINRKDVQYFIEHLRTERGQRKATIEKRVSALSKIVNTVIKVEDLEIKNPFSEPLVPDDLEAQNERVPFHKTHLDLIRNYLETSERLQWSTKAIVPLLMNTGCRPSEIGGLLAEDIVLDHKVPHVRIRGNPFRSLKTSYSERNIPLCGEALVAAKLAVENGSTKGPLFGEKACDTNSLSQRLKKVLASAGIPRSPNRLVPYSFRHSFKQALEVAEIYEPMVERLMGHTPNSITRKYGASMDRLEDLHLAVESALSVLGKVEESIYVASELKATK